MRVAAFLLFSSLLLAAPVARPPITGIAHVAFYVTDLGKAEEFYGHALGLAHFSLGNANCYKVNDRQYIEIYPGLTGDDMDRLSNLAFETTDARRLRDYLESKNVSVPASIKPDANGNLSFAVEDPKGRHIEFVQYLPHGVQLSKAGTLMPSTRVSERLIHSGFIVHDEAAEDRFYHDILGFEMTWYGGMKDSDKQWVDMRVPDGKDWIEYMLRVENPSIKTRGVMNHMALGVSDIHAADQTVRSHAFTPGEDPKIGRDGKWQLNLYDPDLTRVELMEFKPVRTPCCSEMKAK